MVGFCNGWSKTDSSGNPDLGNADANAVQAEMNKGRREWDAKKREWRSPKKWKESLDRNFVDEMGPLKKSISKTFGKQGDRLVREIELSAGGSAVGDVEYQKAYEKIFQKLKTREVEALNEMILAMRVIALGKSKRHKKLLHPGGLTPEQHQAWLDARKKADPESFNKLEGFARMYFNAMEEQLVTLRDAGLISEKLFQDMKNAGDYSPRRYIQFFDPDIQTDALEAITTGSTQALEQDAALLMKDYMLRLHTRIAKNKANVELYNLAKEVKGNGIVEVIGDEDKVADNFESVSAWIDGKKYRMKMPLQYGRDWLQSDPVLSASSAKWARILSGATLVRGLATGYNPEFALTNFPRDMVYSWFRTYDYSSNPIKFPLQLARNLASTASDVWNLDQTPRGAGEVFLKEGGMMEFMTAQGQWFEKKFTKTTGLSKLFGKGFDALSYPGQKTELWVRLALREQAIRKRVDSATFNKYREWLKTDMKTPSPIDPEISREATWIARGYLDFAKGGRYTKAADSMFPYLNAAVLGTTGMFSTFGGGTGSMTKTERAKRIALATWKFTQFLSLVGAVMWYNMTENEDDWDKTDDRDKLGNLIFYSDNYDKTKEGQTSRGYFKIALDQGQSAVASFAGLMISKWARSQNHPVGSPLEKIGAVRDEFWWEGISKLNPATSFVPPTIKALFATANIDTYRQGKIWKGKEVDDKGLEYNAYTHPAYRMAASKLNKMTDSKPFSPERLRYVIDTFFVPSSTVIRGMSAGVDSVVKATAGTEYEEEIKSHLINEKRATFKKYPLDRVFEWTHGESQEQIKRAEIEKISGQTDIVRVDNKVNLLLHDLNISEPDGVDRITKELRKTIDNSGLAKGEKVRLKNRVLDAVSFKRSAGNISDPRFWRKVSQAKSGEVRARIVFDAMKRRPDYADTLKATFRKLKRVSNDRTSRALVRMINLDERGIKQDWE